MLSESRSCLTRIVLRRTHAKRHIGPHKLSQAGLQRLAPGLFRCSRRIYSALREPTDLDCAEQLAKSKVANACSTPADWGGYGVHSTSLKESASYCRLMVSCIPFAHGCESPELMGTCLMHATTKAVSETRDVYGRQIASRRLHVRSTGDLRMVLRNACPSKQQ